MCVRNSHARCRAGENLEIISKDYLLLYFVLILKTKSECIQTKEKIEVFLKKNLHLELNNKTRYYPSSMGVNFCGYRIFTTHKLLKLNSKKKINKNVKHWNRHNENGTLDILKTILSLNSWLGHSSHCNSYKLQNKNIGNCEFLYFANSNYDKTEQYLVTLIDGQKP